MTWQLRLGHFLWAGIIAVGVDASVFRLAAAAGAASGWAKLLGFLAGSQVSLAVARRFTFADRPQRPEQTGRFYQLYGTTLLLNVGTHVAALHLLRPHLPAQAGWLAFAVATGISTMVNFVGQKLWVFRPPSVAPPRPPHPAVAYLPALSAFLGSFWFLAVRFPSLLWDGEMWAEEATNYFFAAHYLPAGLALRQLDSGYLPLLPRLVAQISAALGVTPARVPFVYGAMATGLIAASIASVALPQCRRLIPSDAARLLVAMALLMHGEYQTLTAINFPYYLTIPLFLSMVLAPTLPAGRLVWGGVGGCGAALLILSKPFFLAFAPALGLLLLASLRRRNAAASLFAALAVGGSLLQAGVLLRGVGGAARGPWAPGEFLPALRFVIDNLVSFCCMGDAGLHWAQRPRGATVPPWQWGALALLGAALLANLRHRAARRALAWPALIAASAVPLAVTTAVLPYPQVARAMQQSGAFGDFFGRRFFVAGLVIFLLAALALGQRSGRGRPPVALALFLLFSAPFHLPLSPALEPLSLPVQGSSPLWFEHSAWQAVAPAMFSQPQPRGCIPVNPYPWSFAVDCRMLQSLPDGGSSWENPQFRRLGAPLAAPRAVQAAQVDLVGVQLDGRTAAAPRLVARNAAGEEIGSAVARRAKRTRLAYFYFPQPLQGVRSVELQGDVRVGFSRGPEGGVLWTWFGK